MKLTLPQYDVYYEQLLYPTEPIYNIGAKIKIEGTIDAETFQKAYHEETIILEKNTLTAFPIDVSYSRLPLLFNFAVVMDELKVHISYNMKKYNEDTIQWIWAKYKKLIEELIKFPQQQLSEIEILLPFEEEDMLDVDFNF